MGRRLDLMLPATAKVRNGKATGGKVCSHFPQRLGTTRLAENSRQIPEVRRLSAGSRFSSFFLDLPHPFSVVYKDAIRSPLTPFI